MHAICLSIFQVVALTKQEEGSMFSGLWSLFSVGWRQEREIALVLGLGAGSIQEHKIKLDKDKAHWAWREFRIQIGCFQGLVVYEDCERIGCSLQPVMLLL